MAEDKTFITNASKQTTLAAKAKKAGMSTAAYAKAHAHEGGQAGDESRSHRTVLARIRPKMGSKASS